MCVIIINHQTFKFLIPQHPGTRIFISSEDALSLLLLFAAPLPHSCPPSPVCCGVFTFPIPPHPWDKGLDSALGALQAWSGFPNLLWWSGCDTTLPHLQGWGSLQLPPKSFPWPSRWLKLQSFFPLPPPALYLSSCLYSQPSKATQDLPCPKVLSPNPPIPTHAKKFAIYP